MERPQRRKIPSRLLTECRLPVFSQRTGAEREQDRDRGLRYSESGSNKHSLEVRTGSQPSACQYKISPVQKNTREISPRVSLKSEAKLQGFAFAVAGVTVGVARAFLAEAMGDLV